MRLTVLAALAVSCSAWAQSDVAGASPPPIATEDRPIGEAWQARLRYGLAFRSGGQQDLGPGLTYNGLTPNDLALQAWGWFGYVGGHVSVQREAFSLVDPSTSPPTTVTSGGLLRLAAQLGARLPLGPLRLEPYAGYSFNQLPAFRGNGSLSSTTPTFGAATRHAVLVAARVLLDVSIITLELRGEYPIPLALSVPSMAGTSRTVSNGFGAGAAVRVNVTNFGKLHLGALLDGQFLSDNLAGYDKDGTNYVGSQQQVWRAGIALDLQWKQPTATGGALYGGVIVRVLDVDTGAPLPGADVTIASGGQEQPLAPDAQGALALRGLKAGPFTVHASAEGYLPFESAGSVTAGVDTPIDIKLKKEPPKVGALNITVTELDTKKPLAGVTVKLGDKTATTNEQGVVKFEGLKPGPAAIALSLDKYQPGEEAGSVVAGKTTDVAVTLVPEKQRVPATITGLVRSTKGGTPIPADLEIPQLKIKTKANDKGAFTFRLDGGTYTVKISAPGYITQTKDVTVKDGDQAIFNVDLYPK